MKAAEFTKFEVVPLHFFSFIPNSESNHIRLFAVVKRSATLETCRSGVFTVQSLDGKHRRSRQNISHYTDNFPG